MDSIYWDRADISKPKLGYTDGDCSSYFAYYLWKKTEKLFNFYKETSEIYQKICLECDLSDDVFIKNTINVLEHIESEFAQINNLLANSNYTNQGIKIKNSLNNVDIKRQEVNDELVYARKTVSRGSNLSYTKLHHFRNLFYSLVDDLGALQKTFNEVGWEVQNELKFKHQFK